MKAPPLQHQTERARMKTAAHTAITNSDLNLFTCITRMEVSRLVLVVVHGDHDSKETANLRHDQILLHRLLPLLRRAFAFRRPLGAALIRLILQPIAD